MRPKYRKVSLPSPGGPWGRYRRKLTTSTYSPHDDSTNGVLAIALQNFKVKHVVITGHSNCVGCQQALNVSRLPSVPATTSLQRYLKPIAALASTLSTEDGPCTLDKLVEVSSILMRYDVKGRC
ncbi:MAG: hypothetical protein EOO61_14735 [Hymenobacter sp.]|nr:MAG: hypothetical protein EOO61_14735 [Hymenobacter sp.]